MFVLSVGLLPFSMERDKTKCPVMVCMLMIRHCFARTAFLLMILPRTCIQTHLPSDCVCRDVVCPGILMWFRSISSCILIVTSFLLLCVPCRSSTSRSSLSLGLYDLLLILCTILVFQIQHHLRLLYLALLFMFIDPLLSHRVVHSVFRSCMLSF